MKADIHCDDEYLNMHIDYMFRRPLPLWHIQLFLHVHHYIVKVRLLMRLLYYLLQCQFLHENDKILEWKAVILKLWQGPNPQKSCPTQKFLLQTLWDDAKEFSFLGHMTLVLLVCGKDFEKHLTNLPKTVWHDDKLSPQRHHNIKSVLQWNC